MPYKLILIFLITAFLAGCGNSNPKAGPQKPMATTGAPNASDGPTLIADQPENQTPTKKSKKPKKTVAQTPPLSVVSEPVSQPVAAAPTLPPQSPPQAVIPQKPATPYVVGMGSTGEKPSELDSQGPDFAILKANFCAVSHQYPGGSQCYLVYSDGRTEWSSSGNFKDAEVFVSQLKAQRDAQDQAKKAKKAAKKRKN